MRYWLSCAVVILLAPGVHAQSGSSPDEQAIRALIAKDDAGENAPRTLDSVFWSGAYPKPQIRGGEAVAPAKEAQMDQRQNQSHQTTVRRVVVSKSGDLAYEFSDFRMSIDMKDRSKNEFDGSLLRVWQKDAGQWKVAAAFMRPHDTD